VPAGAQRVVEGGNPGPVGTRERMIAAAEELFAARGIDGVSLREVAVAAGSRNTGAGQYYFGNKEKLVEAIYNHRVAAIEVRRLALLADVKVSPDPLRASVFALLQPLAEQIGVNHYVTFVAQLSADRRRGLHPERSGFVEIPSYTQTRRLIREALPDLDAASFRRRFGLAIYLGIAGLASFESIVQLTPSTIRRRGAVVDELVAALVGLLTAPA
jgi:AcrR family transcriptional regulator